jgi:hypothetical protein
MEDIGTKDDWEAAQWVFILSGVPKDIGVSTEISKESVKNPLRRKEKTSGQ